MNSCIYEGTVRHRRFSPKEHFFSYKLFMLYIDLSEIDSIFQGRLLWSAKRPAVARFVRSDYFGDPSESLDQAIRREVVKSAGVRVDGPIRMLTHIRYFGYCFNPVTFYYCFDPDSSRIEAIVAEITNTPWNERHAYVLVEDMKLGDSKKRRFTFEKTFHVSPFIDMNQEYRWFFNQPGKSLTVHMDNMTDRGKLFDATLTMAHRPLSSRNLNVQLLRFPFMTGQVLAGIYWNALRLWIKGTPFYAHPKKLPNGFQIGQ